MHIAGRSTSFTTCSLRQSFVILQLVLHIVYIFYKHHKLLFPRSCAVCLTFMRMQLPALFNLQNRWLRAQILTLWLVVTVLLRRFLQESPQQKCHHQSQIYAFSYVIIRTCFLFWTNICFHGEVHILTRCTPFCFSCWLSCELVKLQRICFVSAYMCKPACVTIFSVHKLATLFFFTQSIMKVFILAQCTNSLTYKHVPSSCTK